MYDCDAPTVLLNIYSYLVFVGKGHLALVPSHLPHLRLLILDLGRSLHDEGVEELVAAAPEPTFMDRWGRPLGAMRNKLLEGTYACCTRSMVFLARMGGGPAQTVHKTAPLMVRISQ